MKTGLKSCMSRFAVALLACGALLAATTPSTQAGFDFDEKGNCFVAGQAMMSFKAGTTELTARAILTQLGADPSRTKWCDGLLKNINKVIAPTQALRNSAAELARSALVVFPDKLDVELFCKKALAGPGAMHPSAPNRSNRLTTRSRSPTP